MKKLLLVLLVCSLTPVAFSQWQVRPSKMLGRYWVAICASSPYPNRMSVTLYRENEQKCKFDVRFRSEADLQREVPSEASRRYIPDQGGRFYATRAGWVDGKYVMQLGYSFTAHGSDW
jgi:hypothetical protein